MNERGHHFGRHVAFMFIFSTSVGADVTLRSELMYVQEAVRSAYLRADGRAV